jgi:DNA polymerase-3 subunit chi
LLGAAGSRTEAPVTIGFEESGIGGQDLLINLTDEMPPNAASFPRVAELVTSDEESRQTSRKRFKNYRELGVELETHNI